VSYSKILPIVINASIVKPLIAKSIILLSDAINKKKTNLIVGAVTMLFVEKE